MVSSKDNISNGFLSLYDIRTVQNIQSEQFYFKFKEDFHNTLFEKALFVSKNIRQLSKDTQIDYWNLWDCIKRRCPISLTNLRKISNYMTINGFPEYNLNLFEKNIHYIKGGFTKDKVYFPNFPINLKTPEAMRFLGHLYHDGSIGSVNRQPAYVNKSLDQCKEFLEDAKSIFGQFDRKIVKEKDGTFRVHLPTVIGDLMANFGYIIGNRTKQNPPVLKFLLGVKDKHLISQFLASAFSDEGHNEKRGMGLTQACLTSEEGVFSNVILLDKLFLERLGIEVKGPRLACNYINRYGSCKTHVISVYSKKNLSIFAKKIMMIYYKRKKLEAYVWKTKLYK